MTTETRCQCQACRDLLAECGEINWPIYSRKLLKRGWAGQMSRVEKAYVRAHRSRSEKQLAADAALSARLAPYRRVARNS